MHVRSDPFIKAQRRRARDLCLARICTTEQRRAAHRADYEAAFSATDPGRADHVWAVVAAGTEEVLGARVSSSRSLDFEQGFPTARRNNLQI